MSSAIISSSPKLKPSRFCKMLTLLEWPSCKRKNLRRNSKNNWKGTKMTVRKKRRTEILIKSKWTQTIFLAKRRSLKSRFLRRNKLRQSKRVKRWKRRKNCKSPGAIQCPISRLMLTKRSTSLKWRETSVSNCKIILSSKKCSSKRKISKSNHNNEKRERQILLHLNMIKSVTKEAPLLTRM